MSMKVECGTLLAAWPDLMDPNFMHSVLLICQHNEEGAYGLVVNQPTEVTTQQVFPEHEHLGHVAFPVHLGGPVDHTTLQFIHTLPDQIPGGMPLVDGIWIGGDLDALGRLLAADPVAAGERVRLFLGYSGWGAGQLDDELGGHSWIPAPASRDVVFSTDAETSWRQVVRSSGHDSEGLGDLPPDVSWN